jgi:hypothetical protein
MYLIDTYIEALEKFKDMDLRRMFVKTSEKNVCENIFY